MDCTNLGRHDFARRMEMIASRLSFGDRPAVGRITVSSPATMRPLAALNAGRPYRDKIKPFNFLLTCHVKPFGHPTDAAPEHFHLIAPYELDWRRWLQITWIDQYSGNKYLITTDAGYASRKAASVKTYDDVAREYEYHPESKCADVRGNPANKQTVGLLQRRHIYIDLVRYIGKESNQLEEVEAGLVHSEQTVYTEYSDPRRDEWHVKVLPALKMIPVPELVKRCGMSRSALFEVLAGRATPHARNRELLRQIAVRNE